MKPVPAAKLLDTRIYGLASDPALFQEKVIHTRELFHLYNWKQAHAHLSLIIVLMGGTGTGKSTLFNALNQKQISAESVRRPTTGGGIAYMRSDFIPAFQANQFPFPINIYNIRNIPLDGKKDELSIIGHQLKQSLIYIDSPDVDSICIENKNHAHRLLLLADFIIFVTTEEKYADQEPLEIVHLARVYNKKMMCILNKSEDNQLAQTIQAHVKKMAQMDIPFIVIPRKISDDTNQYLNSVDELRSGLENLRKSQQKKTRKQDIKALFNLYEKWMGDIQELVDDEWTTWKKIEKILEDAAQHSKEMLLQSPATFDHAYFDQCIKPHIKDVYNRHDVLAPVRKWVMDILKKPFYLIHSSNPKTSSEIFLPEMDITPLQFALVEYQTTIKRQIGTKVFLDYIQKHTPELDKETTQQQFTEKMSTINHWLTEQFEKLNKGIPIGKRIGMHAISLVWGSAILGIETISGGGLTPIELAVDSLIAPYITAGATELFVVKELKSIVHQLRNQYMKALYAVVDFQHEQYKNVLETLKPRTILKNGLVLL